MRTVLLSCCKPVTDTPMYLTPSELMCYTIASCILLAYIKEVALCIMYLLIWLKSLWVAGWYQVVTIFSTMHVGLHKETDAGMPLEHALCV